MRKRYAVYSLVVGLLIEIAYLLGMNAYTLASEPEPTPVPTPKTQVVGFKTEPQETLAPLTPIPRTPTPEPTPTHDWPEALEYDDTDFRCLATFRKSCVSDKATWITQVVSCEVVQNRTTQDGFPNTIRYVLLEPHEFDGYDSDARVRESDRLVSEFASRSFEEAKNGDFTHRYTPLAGIYLQYSDDLKYCKVYDKNWKILCDTSQFD